MKTKFITLGFAIVLLIAACQKPDQPAETFCWDCTYHADTLKFCDMNEAQIDSLKDVFGYDCPHDLLECNKHQ